MIGRPWYRPGVPIPLPAWCSDPAEIGRLIRWLRDGDGLAEDELEHVLEILEKPWKWDTEYRDMCRGQPSSVEPPDCKRCGDAGCGECAEE